MSSQLDLVEHRFSPLSNGWQPEAAASEVSEAALDILIVNGHGLGYSALVAAELLGLCPEERAELVLVPDCGDSEWARWSQRGLDGAVPCAKVQEVPTNSREVLWKEVAVARQVELLPVGVRAV